jgi:hypothetical protein
MWRRIRWDPARFGEDILFPAGRENIPSWLAAAIDYFGEHGAVHAPDEVFLVRRADAPHFVLVLTEPHLKAQRYSIGLYMVDDEELIVAEAIRGRQLPTR